MTGIVQQSHYAGAIEDFHFFVETLETQRGEKEQETGENPAHTSTVQPLLDERRAWIQQLEMGRNPFDPATLKDLR